MVPNKFHFITATWGEPYIYKLCNVLFPCLLAPKNLTAWKFCSVTKYIIITNRLGAEKITNDINYNKISQFIEINVKILSDDKFNRNTASHWDILRDIQLQQIVDSAKEDAGMIFLAPDLLISNNLLENLSYIIENFNKRAVFVVAPRLSYSSVMETIGEINIQEQPINLEPRECVRLFVDKRAPLMENYFFSSKKILSLAYMFWHIPNYGFICHSAQPYPLYIWPRNKHNLYMLYSLDIDFYSKCGLNYSDMYLVTNSDEMVICGLEAGIMPNIKEYTYTRINSIKNNVIEIMGYCNPFHGLFFLQTVKLLYKQTSYFRYIFTIIYAKMYAVLVFILAYIFRKLSTLFIRYVNYIGNDMALDYYIKKTVKKAMIKPGCKVALYGAGLHTERLLNSQILNQQCIDIVAIFDDYSPLNNIKGIPIFSCKEVAQTDFDVLLISSDAYQSILLKKALVWMKPGKDIVSIYPPRKYRKVAEK